MKLEIFIVLLLTICYNSQAQFGPQRVISIEAYGPSQVYTSDLDGDGDMDVLSSSQGDGKIAWYENTDGLGNFGPQQIIYENAEENALSVHASDLDGDGDKDVLSAILGIGVGNDKIAWHQNINGFGVFGSQQTISNETTVPTDVFTADFDGDNDLDVLSVSRGDDKIAWYSNLDGHGNFGGENIISVSLDWPIYAHTSDIDGDGNTDVISASFTEGKVVWFRNIDGKGNFSSENIISSLTDGALSVYSCDIDNDGDIDVLSTSVNDNKIAWYRNENGLGSFGDQIIISDLVDFPHSVFAIDLDGDSDFDVLCASGLDDKISWYENIDSLGNFGAQQIISTEVDYPTSVYASDIDGDGDQDVLSASATDAKVAWYENITPLTTDEYHIFDFSVHPIPSSDILNIKSKSLIRQIEIFNSLGQLVFSKLNQKKINISNLSNGIYFVKIENENGEFGIKKIIKG